jgi:hypothetical protein
MDATHFYSRLFSSNQLVNSIKDVRLKERRIVECMSCRN